jgi:adenosylcobinamide-GDP ribazoletransferase
VVRSFLIAWHFLMGVRLRAESCTPGARELASSMAWFPLVGLVLGGVLALADVALSGILARGVVDMLLIVLLVVLTGGLHQDGLADCLDGLAGGRTPEERLRIMRDPRVGAIGATGLVLSLGLRYAALSALPAHDRLPLLICMPAVGRWAMVVAAGSAPYGRREGGLGRPFLENLSAWEVGLATLVVFASGAWFLGPIPASIVLVGGGSLAVGWAAFGRRYFGGMTGDTLGALNEIAEVAVLLAGPALLAWR